MEEALRFFRAFEVWIYVILGVGGLIYLRKFILAWRELRGAGFGLERENAQGRLNQSAVMLVLILALAISEFVVVSFIAPTIPGANSLPTPTLSLLVTPTNTVESTTPQPGTPQPATTTPAPTLGLGETGCITGQIAITNPADGQEVIGVVEVTGTANIPNFGFYKYEYKRPDETTWNTIQAGNQSRSASKLGDWDTRSLPPGEYQLGLVVVDNQAQAALPCIVKVRVALTPPETTTP